MTFQQRRAQLGPASLGWGEEEREREREKKKKSLSGDLRRRETKREKTGRVWMFPRRYQENEICAVTDRHVS